MGKQDDGGGWRVQFGHTGVFSSVTGRTNRTPLICDRCTWRGKKEDELEKVDKGRGSFEGFRRCCCGDQQGGIRQTRLDKQDRRGQGRSHAACSFFFSFFGQNL